MTAVGDSPPRLGNGKPYLASSREELGAWLRETRTILNDLQLSVQHLASKQDVFTIVEISQVEEFRGHLIAFDSILQGFQKGCRFHE